MGFLLCTKKRPTGLDPEKNNVCCLLSVTICIVKFFAMAQKDKRMDAFAREAFRLGTLRGFRHFSVELRGREELLLTVRPGPGVSACHSGSGCGIGQRIAAA